MHIKINNTEVQEQWATALESGKYPQGARALARARVTIDPLTGSRQATIGYCCLGVLCELAKDAGVVKASETAEEAVRRAKEIGGTRRIAYGVHDDRALNEASWLPAEVIKWAGLDMADPQVFIMSEAHGEAQVSKLSTMNDGGMSFTEIAGVVRGNAPVVE